MKLSPRVEKTSISRKIHMHVWTHPTDPSVYCKIQVDVTPALKYLEKVRKESTYRITINHFAAKVIGHCIQTFPSVNCILIRNRFFERPNVSLSFMINIETPNGRDLARFLIPDIDKKSLVDIAIFIQEKSQAIRDGNDKETTEVQEIVKKIPNSIFPFILQILDLFAYNLNLRLPKNHSGSAIVSAVGSLGIEETYAPLSRFSRCPLIFVIGKIKKAPVVVGDQIVVGEIATVTLTYDHRYLDASDCANLQKLFKDMFANPEKYADVFGDLTTIK